MRMCASVSAPVPVLYAYLSMPDWNFLMVREELLRVQDIAQLHAV